MPPHRFHPRNSDRVSLPREIWILVAAAFLIALGYGLIAPILPQFILTFDVSMAAAGMVVAIFSASRLLFAPVSGTLIDRLGSRRVYLTGLVIVAVTTGSISLVTEYWHILALRAVAGIGSTMFTVSAMGLIVRIAPANARGQASAAYGSAFLIGNVIGPIAGAAMSFLGMRWPFVIYGAGVALAAVVVWWQMPRTAPTKQSDTTAAPPQQPPLRLGEAWRDSAFRAVVVSNVAHGWNNMGVRVSVLPLFAAAVFADGAALAGLAMAAFALGNAVVLQFSGKMADSYGRKPLIVAGLAGTAALMGVMGFADTGATLLLASLLAGAAAGLLNPAQQAVLADVIGADRPGGKVLSAYQMSMDAGQILGPVLVGALADRFGFALAFAVSALVALAGLAAWSRGRETLTRRGQ
ncbi:MFS transporter [Corynebacterium uterequi]|uniref:Arabinose efflux permease family protein n=1 Tax=Corynebacterium uterequi TaxID=1072256 RepID=A0A0G3HFW4_9CORY|nr:MFS transporter [Corynebacterium uterequi]AKK10848.1 arabinose efflux permease family protein [Corynebacterium uterequi]